VVVGSLPSGLRELLDKFGKSEEYSPVPEILSDRLRLADNLLPNGVRDYLLKHRQDGRSWDWIARELYVDTNREIQVTSVTVQNWARVLGIVEVA
jgi:hypothetical protein